jgi:hypothetical protein
LSLSAHDAKEHAEQGEHRKDRSILLYLQTFGWDLGLQLAATTTHLFLQAVFEKSVDDVVHHSNWYPATRNVLPPQRIRSATTPDSSRTLEF